MARRVHTRQAVPKCAKPFVITVSVIAFACGGGVEEDAGVGPGKPDGGAGTGGSGGTSGCPGAAPQMYAECMPDGLRCEYDFTCQSGPTSVAYVCEMGHWKTDAQCANEGDSCIGRQLHCVGGSWYDYTGAGGNPPIPCPETKPIPGASCPPSSPYQGTTSCGYRCDDGTWSVADCVHGSESQVWLFDGACSGDCSLVERALWQYAGQHRECSVDQDCSVFSSQCALTSDHCSGAFALGPAAEASEWSKLDAALSTCAAAHGGSWHCASCDAVPPSPRCVSGACTFSQ